jgi:hypothetical protein
MSHSNHRVSGKWLFVIAALIGTVALSAGRSQAAYSTLPTTASSAPQVSEAATSESTIVYDAANVGVCPINCASDSACTIGCGTEAVCIARRCWPL